MKKKLGIFLMLLFVLSGIIGFIGYERIFGKNTIHTSPKIVTIPTGSSFEDVVNILDTEKVVKNMASFKQVSDLMSYSEHVKPGRYLIPTSLSNRRLVSLLRSGNQEPIKITLSSARTIEQIAGQAAKKIEADSLSILNAFFAEDRPEEIQMDDQNIVGLIIPNTYEAYWNTSAEGFVKRMTKEYDAFWSKNKRQERCAAIGLSPREVSVLASIVEKESIQKVERPTIAGVYLNRLNSDIPLQADPTVVFGVGDFTIRRVLNRHLAHDSRYNTYMYGGLPPGPICMPSISSIDAVLNAEEHDFIFFCAKPGYNGSHLFAETNEEHERNARVYRRWLNQEGIKG